MTSSTGKGFTLVEMLVVMAVIGLLVAAGVPALTGYATQMRLKGATREVIGLLSLARSSAISSRTPRTVVVNPDTHELVIEETLTEDEPRRVRLASSLQVDVQSQEQTGGPFRVVFQPGGGLAGRSVSLVLSNESRSQTITITAVTGAIAVAVSDATLTVDSP